MASNLAAALTEFGQDTIVIDANLTNPNLGFHLGIPLYPTTLHDVLKGESHLSEATYIHDSGLQVIPAGLSVDELAETKPENLSDALLDTIGEPDFVIVDSAAGLGNESISAIEACDEVVAVTNPDLPAVTDALKTINIAEESGTDITGVVMNKVSDKDGQLNPEEVESMLGHEVLAEIPQHGKIKEALSVKKPVVFHEDQHHVSERFKDMASDIAGINYDADVSPPGLVDKFKDKIGLNQ